MPAPSPTRALLEVRNLAVSYDGDTEVRPVLSKLNFHIDPGKIVGVQGRSGSGKTTLALAILKLLPACAKTSGKVLFRESNLLDLPESELQTIRGKDIAIIYQEPALALNPVMRVGDQIAEVVLAHTSLKWREAKKCAAEMLERVCLSSSRYFDKYPHELSGGECHRIVLAQALSCRPGLVIADEPTAGLDPLLKNEIVGLIQALQREFGSAFLLISHDADVISRLANRTIHLVAETPANIVANVAGRTSAQGTLSAAAFPQACSFPNAFLAEPLLEVRNLGKWYRTRGLFRRRRTEKHALDAVDLSIPAGSVVGLIGPSGCGKSTLARCIAVLEAADCGEIYLEQQNLLALPRSELRKLRPLLQYIAQDPAAALNPHLSAAEVVEEPLLIQSHAIAQPRADRVRSLLQQVGIAPASAHRSCHEFSGGQKQRLVIARALALQPKLLILDESLSGLDPETREGILQLLRTLKEQLGITQLLISHDLELISAFADSIAVMREGRIVDHQSTAAMVRDCEHWSAEHLLHSVPRRDLVLTEAE